MIDKERAKLNPKVQWTKFVCVLVLYLLFLYWVGSWWGLLVVPFIYDVYITKRIHWQWWKDAERPVRFIMSWVDISSIFTSSRTTSYPRHRSKSRYSQAIICL